jgi:hypothetical protein
VGGYCNSLSAHASRREGTRARVANTVPVDVTLYPNEYVFSAIAPRNDLWSKGVVISEGQATERATFQCEARPLDSL